ncbi:MAG TPA: zinc ribbon domain-containing protein [Candidatus Thermoplasmatota archaeon]|nr:zinc ribbon domain-containing protein [Candidatus Thermoplasmatota archaeon]
MGRMDLGQVLSGAFRIVFDNLGLYVSTMGVFIVLEGLVGALVLVAFLSDLPDPEASPALFLANLAAPTALAGVAGFVFTLFAVYFGIVVTDGLLRGERRGLSQAWAMGQGRFGHFAVTLLVTMLVPMLLIVGGLAPLFLTLVAGAASPEAFVAVAPLVFLSLLGAIVLAVWLYLRWYVAPVAAALEAPGAVGDRLSRSRALTQGSRLSILGLLVILAIVGAILSAIATAPLSLALGGESILVQALAQQAGGVLVSLVMTPVGVAAAVLVYASLAAPAPAPFVPVPWPAPPPSAARFCPACGAYLAEGAAFCGACGRSVGP